MLEMKCPNLTTMFGLKRNSKPEKLKSQVCGQKIGCCEAKSVSELVERWNMMGDRQGGWAWSLAKSQNWLNFATTKPDYEKVKKLCTDAAANNESNSGSRRRRANEVNVLQTKTDEDGTKMIKFKHKAFIHTPRKKLTFGMSAKSSKGLKSDDDWDQVVQNNKCEAFWPKFIGMARLCHPLANKYNEYLEKCYASIFETRHDVMCASCDPRQTNLFKDGKLNIFQSKMYKARGIDNCHYAAWIERNCTNYQLQ